MRNHAFMLALGAVLLVPGVGAAQGSPSDQLADLLRAAAPAQQTQQLSPEIIAALIKALEPAPAPVPVPRMSPPSQEMLALVSYMMNQRTLATPQVVNEHQYVIPASPGPRVPVINANRGGGPIIRVELATRQNCLQRFIANWINMFRETPACVNPCPPECTTCD